MNPIRALCALLLSALAAPALAINPNDVAPEVGGIVLQGPENANLARFAGRVIVLDFWASWCGPCIESMPQINGIRESLRQEGLSDEFEVLGVGLDDDLALARKFLDKHPVGYPMIVDQLGIATQRYKVWRLPATLLIDRSGHVNYIYWGYGEDSVPDMKARIKALIKDKPLPG
jgi:thiol-disulfide isomerase/thioredoxin